MDSISDDKILVNISSMLLSVEVIQVIKPGIRYKIFKLLYDFFICNIPDQKKINERAKSIIESIILSQIECDAPTSILNPKL